MLAAAVVATMREAPLPSVLAIQMTRSPPLGLLDGSAIHPSRFASLPRANVTVFPSSEI